MRKNDTRISIRIPKALLELLDQACDRLKEDKSAIVKRSLVLYLDYVFRTNQQSRIKQDEYE